LAQGAYTGIYFTDAGAGGGVEHPAPALCKPLVGSSISGFHVRTLKELVRGEGLNMMNTL